MKKNALDPEPYNMTDKDKEAVDLLLETLETCNVKVIQVIICDLYSAIQCSDKYLKEANHPN